MARKIFEVSMVVVLALLALFVLFATVMDFRDLAHKFVALGIFSLKGAVALVGAIGIMSGLIWATWIATD